MLQGPGENAGAVDIGDGLAAVFKIESHNHPSFIEPYQGAATGVGGIIRDIFTMGARPIALLELAALRIARRAAARARAASKASSPASPATATASAFRRSAARSRSSRRYAGNPLVNVFCLGIAQAVRHHQGRRVGRRQRRVLRRRQDRPRRHPRRDDGVGGVRREVGGEAAGRAGRRSVHGEAAARGLPRGDADRRARRHPGHGRRGTDLLDDARWDRAAAPASRSTCRSCRSARPGMTPYEIMLSESQERMLLVVKRGREAEVERIFEKWDLHAVHIGEVTADGMLRVKDRGAVVAEIPNRALTDEAPVYRPADGARPEYLDGARSSSTSIALARRRRDHGRRDALLRAARVADHREQALDLPAVRPHGAHQHDQPARARRRRRAHQGHRPRARDVGRRQRPLLLSRSVPRRDAGGRRSGAQRRVRRRARRSARPTA